jgi:hypothetical protein
LRSGRASGLWRPIPVQRENRDIDPFGYPPVTGPNGFEISLALILDNIETIPFDLQDLRVLVYDKNEHDWGEKINVDIQTSIHEILENPELSILTTFLEVIDQPDKSVTQFQK